MGDGLVHIRGLGSTKARGQVAKPKGSALAWNDQGLGFRVLGLGLRGCFVESLSPKPYKPYRPYRS